MFGARWTKIVFERNQIYFINFFPTFQTCAKVLIDDIDVEANGEYLDISASIDRTSFDEPVANIDIVLKKDVDHLLVKVSLCAKINDEYKEIVPTMEFNPCNKNEIPDELVKFAMGEIEKHGNLTLTCPLNSVRTS